MIAGIDYSEYWKVNQDDMTFTTPSAAGLFPNNRILVAKKEATDNDPTWYNWYSDGWCEQGGRVNSVAYNSATKNVTFSIPMKDNAYYATAIPITDATNDGSWNISTRVAGLTTTQMTVRGGLNANGAYTGICNWEISGYAEIPTVSDYTENVNLYFKVANAVQNLELLDAGEVLEAVADVVQNNRELITSYCCPDYANAINLGLTGTWKNYTCPSNGYIDFLIVGYRNGISGVRINSKDIVITKSSDNGYIQDVTGQYMVQKGDIVSFAGTYGNGTDDDYGTQYIEFIPMKGVN
jgi:hypothetical protein